MNKYTIELDREEDGRIIAEVKELPGVLVYGQTESEAIARVEALALRVIADRVEHGEVDRELAIAFDLPSEIEENELKFLVVEDDGEDDWVAQTSARDQSVSSQESSQQT